MDNKALVQYLEQYVTEARNQLFERVLDRRTQYICVVLEDIYQPQNASAVLRSMDCFGIQNAHIIENENEYRINPDVTLGASKWLTLSRYNREKDNTTAAVESLKAEGYRIVATTPHKHGVELPDFNIEKGKVALLFGTEMRGLTQHAIQIADEYLRIPNYGFTESFNISVSAAVILYQLTLNLLHSSVDWKLHQAQRWDIKLQWLKNSIKHADLLVENFLSNSQNP